MRFRVILLLSICFASVVHGQESKSERILNASESTAAASPRLPSGTTPTLTDLLSRFAAALQSYNETGGQGFALEHKIPGLGPRLAGKVQVVLRQPRLHEKFVEALSGKTEQIASLEKDLNFDDDVAFVLKIGPTAAKAEKQVEKALKTSDTELVGLLQRDNQAAVDPALREVHERAFQAFAVAAPADDPNSLDAFDRVLNGGFQDALVLQSVREGAAGDARDVAPLRAQAAVTTNAVVALTEQVAVLAANQSKFTLDASYRDRQEMAGPDEWFVKTTYEWGVGTNVAKRIENKGDQHCADAYRTLANDDNCDAAFAETLKETVEDDDVKMGSRVTFSLEYKEFSEVNLTAPVAFALKGSRSLIYSLAAGRDLLEGTDINKRGRIELSIAYDDVTDDNDPSKNRKDRLIGKLTYSQRLSENMDLPISLTYANHDDYLTNVDRKLSAHFGISYKLPDMKKK